MALPFLEYLLERPVVSVIIGRDRIVPVAVPDPGRFCLHKLAVHSLRGSGDHPKRDKDLFQASVLLAALAEEADFRLEDAREAMSKSLRSKARAGALAAARLLEDEHSRAADWVASLTI
jgi:hypothetical protein